MDHRAVALELDPPACDTGIGAVRTLAQGSIATLVHFRHHDRPHRDPDDEVFRDPTIVFTVSGRWRIRSLDVDAAVDRDVVVFAHTGQHYRCGHFEAIPTDEQVSVHLHEPRLRDLLSRYPPFGPAGDGRLFPATAARKTPALARIEQTLVSEAARRAPGRALRLDLLAVDLLVEAARLSGAAPSADGSRAPRERDRVEAARAYLVSHFAGDVDLATLARVAELSPYHFSRVFKAHVGLPPHRYLTHLRIAEAMRLLRETALPVTEICYEVGFQSLSHFITTFRRHTGATPSRYRRR